ncbi:MAG: hypothetical protein DYH02_13515 [Candidatus Omnitrophica bacterium COP1]|nr:hypothetical protein [Candidatus Omnitrophica bacterium COP1]
MFICGFDIIFAPSSIISHRFLLQLLITPQKTNLSLMPSIQLISRIVQQPIPQKMKDLTSLPELVPDSVNHLIREPQTQKKWIGNLLWGNGLV